MAGRLSMTVGELRARMSQAEFQMWRAYQQFEINAANLKGK